jgi:predicted TIM-barrel fold metal-dependent hydrolase
MDQATALYACDDHLDPRAVPPDLWQSRLPAALRDRAPRAVDRDGQSVWVCDDRVLGGSGPPANATLAKSLNAIGRAGIEDDGYRAANPKLRLEDMELDGLWASVIYGPLALGLPIDEPALQAACYAAWNDWAVDEFNAVAPDRLCVLAFLPSSSPDVAAAELERCAALGHRGAILSIFDVDVGDRAWDRVWAAAADTGLPISFHIRDGSWSGLSYRMGKWQSAAFATILPLQLDEPLATVIFSGALERHPGLTVVLAESGLGWIPYFLARMDAEWRSLKDKLDYAPSSPPSELFRRQVMVTFEEDELASQAVPVIGADSCMWASDIRTPTARSRTRDKRSRGRSGNSPPATGERSPRPTARTSMASARDRGSNRGHRSRVPTDVAHRCHGGVLPRSRLRRGRASGRGLGLRRQPNDQLSPTRDVAARRDGAVAGPMARACTSVIRTATSWSS